MLDHHTLWAVAQARNEERLQEAAAWRRAQELPRQPSVLRATLSRWLHLLANRIEPNTEPFTGVTPASAQAR